MEKDELLKRVLMMQRLQGMETDSEYREDAELTQKLLKTIESLTQQVAEITAENKKLQQQIDELLKQI